MVLPGMAWAARAGCAGHSAGEWPARRPCAEDSGDVEPPDAGTTLFETILGLQTLWQIARVALDPSGERVELRVEHTDRPPQAGSD
jgi:hypothetical protein